jgi:hypothetical protein
MFGVRFAGISLSQPRRREHVNTFNPKDHLVQIRAKDGAMRPYYPASWRLYQLSLEHPQSTFRIEVLLMDVEANVVVVKAILDDDNLHTEAVKSGPLSAIDKVETAAKARCCRDFGISTEAVLEGMEQPLVLARRVP